jgi:hypothetical protein
LLAVDLLGVETFYWQVVAVQVVEMLDLKKVAT